MEPAIAGGRSGKIQPLYLYVDHAIQHYTVLNNQPMFSS